MAVPGLAGKWRSCPHCCLTALWISGQVNLDHHGLSSRDPAALALALQLGDAALTQAIAAQQAPQPLLAQLIAQYPWAAEALQARFESLLQETVDEAIPLS